MIDAETMRDRLAAELSVRARVGYALLMTAALLMTGGVISLAATEPALPLRTTLAFACLAAVGLSWAAFAAWVLRHRRALLPTHRLIATRLSMAVSLSYTAVCVAVGLAQASAAPLVAAALGAVQTAIAVALHARARTRVEALRARRAEIEAAMGPRSAQEQGNG
ncbi:MAG TPA: hypothetical protein VFO19_18610 [Vicinamibacterales bacterium]|nr:hypothetical protein [Vicinamibacterales bacterium]